VSADTNMTMSELS